MRTLSIAAAFCGLAFLSLACGFSQEASPIEPSIELERAFPEQKFDTPLFMTDAGDGSGRLFVIEKRGTVLFFDSKNPEKPSQVFLDISEKVSLRGNEEGLLGIAFHPKYKENGFFYLHYSSSVENKTGILARFQVSAENPSKANPDSEMVLLTQAQPWRNHNGGMVEFGPDGFLYLALGDGGAGGDPKNSGQDTSTWLGAILRIDVDTPSDDRPYGIPADNPFAKPSTEGNDGAKPEIFAYGLRNVWRFSFDRKTGELWAGDVGQGKWEEVDIVKNGGNYGWNVFEGFDKFSKKNELAGGPHIEPVAVYPRSEGISITGGYVYRGKRYPALQGSYFYGDYATGNIWRLQKDAQEQWQAPIALKKSGHAIASFAEDAEGELYVLSYENGGIYRIQPKSE